MMFFIHSMANTDIPFLSPAHVYM
uniref:Uncharacterized protein n=1 Tax=Arundo donax TaxID=35708 RepID=A0A0A9G4M4_ARUDO